MKQKDCRKERKGTVRLLCERDKLIVTKREDQIAGEYNRTPALQKYCELKRTKKKFDQQAINRVSNRTDEGQFCIKRLMQESRIEISFILYPTFYAKHIAAKCSKRKKRDNSKKAICVCSIHSTTCTGVKQRSL